MRFHSSRITDRSGVRWTVGTYVVNDAGRVAGCYHGSTAPDHAGTVVKKYDNIGRDFRS